MNIVLFNNNSKFYYFRPDISLNRDCNDYFCPEGINELAAIPFIYIKMERAAKAVSAKFASRYYKNAGYGLILNAKGLETPEEPASWNTARSLDNTLYITPAIPLERFECSGCPTEMTELFNRKIEEITKFSSLRTGDLVCMEMTDRETIYEKRAAVSGKSRIETAGIAFQIIW